MPERQLRTCPYCGEESLQLPAHIRSQCEHLPATNSRGEVVRDE
ncbi:hypothetical protein [Halomarina rubra]|uniref:Uncharacterized protein n=1 Tax=Halomarina rubra TaxID=2071873 RepID=A0ABD6ASQ9_9EURY|nr:hypothetical protein [Halomarina rubra]